LLWVQQDPREDCNHALEYAAQVANRLKLPLRAVFGLYERFPEANERCFAFLLHGLADLRADLHRRGVELTVLRAPPPTAAIHLAKHAAVLVCDRGYPRLARAWRSEVARGVSCPVIMVETTVVSFPTLYFFSPYFFRRERGPTVTQSCVCWLGRWCR